DVAALLRASDICLCQVKNVPVLGMASPNKLFDALAAGKPVIVNMDGWMRDLVEENVAGCCAEPGSGASIAEQILRLARDPELRARMGRNAGGLAEEQFDRRRCARQLEEILAAAAGVAVADEGAVIAPEVAAIASGDALSLAPGAAMSGA